MQLVNTVVLLLTDPSFPVQPNPIVPNIYAYLGNDSIKAVTKNLSWDEAQKQCKGDKANLINLRNEWTQAYVELLASTFMAPLWIGLNKKQVDGSSISLRIPG